MQGIEEASGADWKQKFLLSKAIQSYRKSGDAAVLLTASAVVIEEMKQDVIRVVRLTDNAVPLQRYTDISHDLRQYRSPDQLQELIQENGYAVDEAVEATIRSCRAHEDWHVWISTIVATSELRRNAVTNTFAGSFLYPESRSKIVRAVTSVPFRRADEWVDASLAALTRHMSSLPHHFAIKMPKTQGDFARLAHGVLVRREMRVECADLSILPYCYGMYECSGTYTAKDGVVVNTCAPIQGYDTSGYAMERLVQGPTLLAAARTMTGANFEKVLMVISASLAYLYQKYGFVHCNLSPNNIILEGVGDMHDVRYMLNGPRVIRLPFIPRLLHFEDAITTANPWVSAQGVPGQSPAIDVYRLYKGLVDGLKGKTHKLDLAPLEADLKSLTAAGLTGTSLLPKPTAKMTDIHQYILQRYEGDHKPALPEVAPTLGPGVSQLPVDYEADANMLATSLQTLEDSKNYIQDRENAKLLRQWLSSYFTEDLAQLGTGYITLNVLPNYYTADGTPLYYASDDTLVLKREDGTYLVDINEDGVPVVYNGLGQPVLYDEGFGEAEVVEEEEPEEEEEEQEEVEETEDEFELDEDEEE